ncbi:MAG: hypothetical protein E7558_03645 [Ruminococcaceae bacterium]|nr:hypothetical protein [Oscillospiraceae bacterium]
MSKTEYLYHYTSIETLALILKNRTIRFNSLDKMDDLQEQQFFLLMHAYMWEPDKPVVKMKDTLLENMFSEDFNYDYPKNKKLDLAPSIFKEIEKYDVSIEVYRLGRQCCEIIYHIFDKETRLEVATYCDIGG